MVRSLLLLPMAAMLEGGAVAQDGPREAGKTSLYLVQSPGEAAAAELKIEVPAVLLATPASELPFAIAIAPESAIPPQSFLRIRGLPPTVALSDGYTIHPGAWAVPLAAMKGLRLVVPAGLSGKREVTISLVRSDGTTIAESRLSMVIAAAALIAPGTKEKPLAPPPATELRPSDAPAPEAASAPPPGLIAGPSPATPNAALPKPSATPAPPAPAAEPAPEARPAPPQPQAAAALPPVLAPKPAGPPAAPAPPAEAQPKAVSPEARQRIDRYLARASELLRDGDIASARLFLQRAADEGVSDAALRLGATFDPVELAKLRAHGIRPDPAEARRWYERAAELGNGEALDRLKRLGAR